MAYVRTRVGRLFYNEHGEARRPGAPSIVLLHGLLFDGSSWRGQVDALAALGRVLVVDGPGHGKSDRPPRFTLEDHADAVHDALGELEVPRAVVVGLSWGGMIGMRLALQHPAEVAGLALFDTSAERQTLAERVRYRAFVALHRRVGIPPWLFRREVVPLMFAERTALARPELVDASYRRAMGFDREGVARASLAVVVQRTAILGHLGRVRAPTLVLSGREDRATPLSHSERIAGAIPGARLVVLDGVGHMSALEDPAQANGHLVPFVHSVLDAS
jgi:3-oxoadipate enol-lactonase